MVVWCWLGLLIWDMSAFFLYPLLLFFASSVTCVSLLNSGGDSWNQLVCVAFVL